MQSLTTQDLLARFLSNMSSLLSGAQGIVTRHPVLTVSATVAAALFPLAHRNLQSYKALGRGGYKYQVVGWIVAVVLKPFGRNTISVEEYEKDEDKSSWLKVGEEPTEIPLRGRERPKTGWHFLPHRQVEQFPDEKIQQLLTREFTTIAETNTDLIQVGRSPHENFSDALLVRDGVPSPHRVADASWREIGHVHSLKDFSMHITLSPQDSKLVIERGWGERHPISGVIHLPKEYLMIYAPLTEDDVRVVGRIVRASVGYMTGSKDVR